MRFILPVIFVVIVFVVAYAILLGVVVLLQDFGFHGRELSNTVPLVFISVVYGGTFLIWRLCK